MPIYQRVLGSGSKVYGGSDLYGESEGEDILPDVTFANTLSCLKQLQDLASFSNEIFSGLSELAGEIHNRIDSLQQRTNYLSISIDGIRLNKEECFDIKRDDYQNTRQFIQKPKTHTLVNKESMPLSMINRYEAPEVRRMIPLYTLDDDKGVLMHGAEIDTVGRRYSNPDFFLRQWVNKENKRMEEIARERKQQRADKKMRKSAVAQTSAQEDFRKSKKKISISWQERFIVDGKAVNRVSTGSRRRSTGWVGGVRRRSQQGSMLDIQEEDEERGDESLAMRPSSARDLASDIDDANALSTEESNSGRLGKIFPRASGGAPATSGSTSHAPAPPPPSRRQSAPSIIPPSMPTAAGKGPPPPPPPPPPQSGDVSRSNSVIAGPGSGSQQSPPPPPPPPPPGGRNGNGNCSTPAAPRTPPNAAPPASMMAAAAAAAAGAASAAARATVASDRRTPQSSSNSAVTAVAAGSATTAVASGDDGDDDDGTPGSLTRRESSRMGDMGDAFASPVTEERRSSLVVPMITPSHHYLDVGTEGTGNGHRTAGTGGSGAGGSTGGDDYASGAVDGRSRQSSRVLRSGSMDSTGGMGDEGGHSLLGVPPLPIKRPPPPSAPRPKSLRTSSNEGAAPLLLVRKPPPPPPPPPPRKLMGSGGGDSSAGTREAAPAVQVAVAADDSSPPSTPITPMVNPLVAAGGGEGGGAGGLLSAIRRGSNLRHVSMEEVQKDKEQRRLSAMSTASSASNGGSGAAPGAFGAFHADSVSQILERRKYLEGSSDEDSHSDNSDAASDDWD